MRPCDAKPPTSKAGDTHVVLQAPVRTRSTTTERRRRAAPTSGKQGSIGNGSSIAARLVLAYVVLGVVSIAGAGSRRTFSTRKGSNQSNCLHWLPLAVKKGEFARLGLAGVAGCTK